MVGPPRSVRRDTRQAQYPPAAFGRKNDRSPMRAWCSVATPAEDLPQPVDDQDGHGRGQRPAADRIDDPAHPQPGLATVLPRRRLGGLPAAGRGRLAAAVPGHASSRRTPPAASAARGSNPDRCRSRGPAARTGWPRTRHPRPPPRPRAGGPGRRWRPDHGAKARPAGDRPRTRDMSSLSSSTGQPPRLSSEAKPVPKSSSAIRTPASAIWAKKLELTAAVPVCSLTSSASMVPGTCSWRRSSVTTAGKPWVDDGLGTDVHRDRDDHPGRGPGPVLRQRQPSASAG